MLNDFLSKRGKKISFPVSGILNQSAQAKHTDINATIGIAMTENKTPLGLNSIFAKANLPTNSFITYAPCLGNANLREKWRELILQKNPAININDISLPVVTHALTHGIFITAQLFIDENDQIIIPAPYWENYDLIFQDYFDGKISAFNLFKNAEFNFNDFERALNNNSTKKLLVLNFPHNPTGFMPDNETLTKIITEIKNAANKSKLIILIDDAYAGLIYDNNINKQSIFANLINIHENVLTIKIDGISKEYYSWGLRLGFLTYNSKNFNKETYDTLINKTAAIIRATISNAANISEEIILHALNDVALPEKLQENFNLLKERFTVVKNILTDKTHYQKHFETLPFNSGYFMCIKPKNINAETLRKFLLEKYNTGVIVFDDLIRISYSSVPKKLLPELFENIYNSCLNLTTENQIFIQQT